MPFKPIDFQNIAPQGNPFFRDLVENLSTGYKAGQLPQQLERQRQKEELANQLQKYLVEEQPQKFSEESQGRQLQNAFQTLLNQEQPQKFGSEQASAAILRAFQQAQTGKINTMTPLEAQKAALENLWYPKAEQAKINEQNSLADYRKLGGGRTSAGAKAEIDFQNAISQDNPHLQPEEIDEATEVLRNGGDTLENGKKLNPLTQKAQDALDRIAKSGTTATITAQKKVARSIENVLPLLDKLMEMHEPGQLVGKYWSPSRQALYDSIIASTQESLAPALSFPQTNIGVQKAETILRKQPFENEIPYHKRLADLKKDLLSRYARNPQHQRVAGAQATSSEKVEAEGIIDGKPVVKVNGKWHYK